MNRATRLLIHRRSRVRSGSPTAWKWIVLGVATVLACASASEPVSAADSSVKQPPSPAETPAPARTEPTWSGGIEAYGYLLEDGNGFLLVIAEADRGSLHLEGRYQYEDLDTGSLWVGWTLETGKSLHLEAVPMVGVVFGNTNGFAPGLELTLSWKSLELYSESEVVFDTEGAEGDFFYNWTEFSWQAAQWLKVGLVAQRTRMFKSELAIDRGLFAAVDVGPVGISLYGFNLAADAPFVVLALAVDF